MTIKAIKEKYQNFGFEIGQGKTYFVTHTFKEIGKCVVIVVEWGGGYGKCVHQIVRVSDGKEILGKDNSRVCDSLSDAIDVAQEMYHNSK